MKKQMLLIILLVTCITSFVSAQEAEVTPEVPFATIQPPTIITQLPEDARAAACNAYQRQNFEPYVVRRGDTLGRLLADQTAATVTQVAALNCIDDPNALPVGSVIFLPVRGESVTPPAATGDPAAIIGFAASSETVVNTDSVTFTWTGTGDAAYFFACPPDRDDPCSRPSSADPLPVEGTVTIGGFSYTGTFRYGLEVVGAGDPAQETVSVEVTCAQEWLGEVGALPLCAEEPALTVYAAWQPFEHGMMFWFSDVGLMYIFSDDGTFRVYTDNYIEGQPDPSDVAPEGLQTPTRGFGLLWASLGGADSGLGWATAPELGFDSARQPAGRISYTTYLQGPYERVYAITELPNADVGYWTTITG